MMNELSAIIGQLKNENNNTGNENEELNLDYNGSPLQDSIKANKDNEDDFNFSKYLQGAGIEWDKIYDSQLIKKETIGDFIKTVLADTVNIDDYKAILIAAFTLTPSAMITVAPILFPYGETGGGKSGIGQLIAALYGVPVYGVTTYAGMRNLIHQKFVSGKRERNYCFIIDDINDTFLNDSNIFSMLKSGCYRQYEKIAMSGKEVGTLEYFYCFCPKVLSSKFNFFNDKRFIELNRRFLPIPTKKTRVPKYDINGINFTGANLLFDKIWKNKELCQNYSDSLKEYNLSLQRLAEENEIPPDQLTILLPQAITAIEFNLSRNIKEYFLCVKSAWKEARENAANTQLDEPCHRVIKKYSKIKDFNEMKYEVIRHQSLVDAIKYLRRMELTDFKMTNIKKALRNQGWNLTTDLGDENYWIKPYETEDETNSTKY